VTDKHRHCPGCGYPTDHADSDPFCSACVESGAHGNADAHTLLAVAAYKIGRAHGRITILIGAIEAVTNAFAPGSSREVDALRSTLKRIQAQILSDS